MGRDSPSHASCRFGPCSSRQLSFHTDDAPRTSRKRQRAGPTAGPLASLSPERFEGVVPGELSLTLVVDLPTNRQVGLLRCVGTSYLMRWEEASEGRRLTCSPTHRKHVFASYSLYTQSSGRVSLIDTYGGCGRVVVGVRSIKLRWSYCWLQFRLLLILGLPSTLSRGSSSRASLEF